MHKLAEADASSNLLVRGSMQTIKKVRRRSTVTAMIVVMCKLA